MKIRQAHPHARTRKASTPVIDDTNNVPGIVPTELLAALAQAGEHLTDSEQAAVATAHQEHTDPLFLDFALAEARAHYALALHQGGAASTAARRVLSHITPAEKPYYAVAGQAYPTVTGVALLLGVTPEELWAEVQRQCGDNGDLSTFDPPETWIRRGANTLTTALATNGPAGLLPATLDRLAAEQDRSGGGPHAW